ncbi:MAG: lysophospholipid acyltransferase family protein [Candidatus Aminicenantales bacterium]
MRTIIVLLFISAVALFVLVPLIVFAWITGLNRVIISAAKIAIRVSQWLAGINVEAKGLEKVDRKASYVFMANHLSLIDGPLLFMLIPQPVRVLLKKEAFRIPVIGQGMSQVAFVPVDRRGLKGGKRSIEWATRLMREKEFSFLIFPEGTRSRDGFLQRFKRGGFFLAINSQRPIVPVSLKGTFEIMPKGSFFMKRGKIRVVFHEPVPVRGYTKKNLIDLLERVRNVVRSGLEEERNEVRAYN